MGHWIYVCVVERLCHWNVSARVLFTLCVPFHMLPIFKSTGIYYAFPALSQVPGTKYNFLNSFGYAARTKCSKQMLRIVMITVLHKEKSAHKRNSSTRESNKMWVKSFPFPPMSILPNYQMMVMMITNADKVRVKRRHRWATSQRAFGIGSLET